MSPFRPSLAVVAAAWLLAPAAALAADPPAADAPVATAPIATAKGAPAAPPDTTAADIKNFIAEGADAKSGEPLPDHRPHGYVEVGAGTRGYREVSGAVTMPVGDQTQVSVAIDAGQVDGRKH